MQSHYRNSGIVRMSENFFQKLRHRYWIRNSASGIVIGVLPWS
jgi:hypothetical protein